MSEASRRHARPWRIAFVAFAIALTTGTHWPAFKLAPDVPATDKSLHFIAFAGLTLLLWRTRWSSRRWLVVLVALAWAALDEWSQGIPILHRWVTWQDGLANALGVVSAGAWLWALGPLGGAPNRRRLALHGFAFDRLFVRTGTWALLAGIFGACVLPVLLTLPLLAPEGTARLIVIVVIVWAHASVLLVIRLWNAERIAVRRERPCFGCGEPARAVDFGGDETAACPGCATPLHVAQWLDPPTPPSRASIRFILAAAAPAAVAIVFAFVWLDVLPSLYGWLNETGAAGGAAPRIARAFGRMPAGLGRMIDVAACLLLFAVTTRVYRSRVARWYDGPLVCRTCGHDLRATPISNGRGRCGECGTSFAVR